MRAIKTLVLTVLLAVMLVMPAIGCGDGVAQTKEDWARSTRRCFRYDKQILMDDLALITLTNRPQRLSRFILD